MAEEQQPAAAPAREVSAQQGRMATTDEYFPATNAFLRSLTEPEPAPRPPSTRSESAAASVNWRVADATERAATDRAERASKERLTPVRVGRGRSASA